jgi:hypothetical protein
MSSYERSCQTVASQWYSWSERTGEISHLAKKLSALTSEKLAWVRGRMQTISVPAMSAHAKWWLAKSTPEMSA